MANELLDYIAQGLAQEFVHALTNRGKIIQTGGYRTSTFIT